MARHQMVAFLLLTYLISRVAVVPAEGALIPHGPMIAAFTVLVAVSGRRGGSDLWRRMTHWRVGWKWYVIAPGLVIGAHLCALMTSLLLGARIVDTAHVQSLPACLALVAPLAIAGGQWEEPGWLGYALRRSQERFPHWPLVATSATGIIRMAWHTPLLLYGWIPWYDYLFGTFALHVALTWLHNATGGSLLIPMTCHQFSNVLMATMRPLLGGSDQGQYWLLYTVAMSAIALGVLLATGGALGSRGARPRNAEALPVAAAALR